MEAILEFTSLYYHAIFVGIGMAMLFVGIFLLIRQRSKQFSMSERRGSALILSICGSVLLLVDLSFQFAFQSLW